MITAATLLAVPLTEPERVFSFDRIERNYRDLAKQFHPDAGGDADAFAHLNALHTEAKRRAAAGEWRVPGLLELVGTDGKLRRIHYAVEHDVGVGTAYIGRTLTAYTLRDDYADLANTAALTIAGLKFPNSKFEESMRLRLPAPRARFNTETATVLVQEKPEDTARLADVLAAVGGRLDPKHVCWVTSELLNICCYLEWARVVHCDVSLDSVYVSPTGHTALLQGGWWYASRAGERMARVQTGRTVCNLRASTAGSKVASFDVDLDQVRLLGRELLGDPGGSRLTTMADVPAPLASWLRTPSSGSARKDYAAWPDVLKASFGARRFVKLDVDLSVIYERKNYHGT